MSLTLTPATRLANFRRVVAERGLTPQSLAQRLGSRYSYWRDLLAGQKSFGEKAARRIEEGLDLPRGWLDQIYGWENELDEGRKARQALASRLGIPSEPTKENDMKIDPSTFDDKISTPEGFMAWQTAIEAEMERSYLEDEPYTALSTIAANLRILTEERGGVVAMAKEMGIGTGTLRRALGAEEGDITLSTLESLARHFHLEPYQLLMRNVGRVTPLRPEVGMKITSQRHLRRRANLAILVDWYEGGAAELARDAGTPKSHISAMLSGDRGMGDELAAKLERIAGKPTGWMDR